MILFVWLMNASSEAITFDDILDVYNSEDNEYIHPCKFIEHHQLDYFIKHYEDIGAFIQWVYFSWSERSSDDLMKTILYDIAYYYEHPNRQTIIDKYYSLYERLNKTDEAIQTTINDEFDYCVNVCNERQVQTGLKVSPLHDCVISSITDDSITLKLKDQKQQ